MEQFPDWAAPPLRTMTLEFTMRMTIDRPRASQRVVSRRIWVAGTLPSDAAELQQARHVLWTARDPLPRAALDGASRTERFQPSSPATRVCLAGVRYQDAADFSCPAILAAQDFAHMNNPAPHLRADRETDQQLRATACSIVVFAEGTRIGAVVLAAGDA
jgi:hypothetical protein